MTKRSKITLFGLLALVAAFGLILTGCPDPNTEIKTEWQDKPSVKVESVEFRDGVSGTTFVELKFVVSLPSGASWDETAIDPLAFDNVAFNAAFTVDYHGNTDAVTAVGGLITADAITAVADGQKLTITIGDGSEDTTTYASKISVGINSVAGIAALIANNPELTLNTHAKEWNTPKALISVADVSFVDATATDGIPSISVKLKLSKGTWNTSLTEDIAATLLTITVGAGDPSTYTKSVVFNGDTLTYTLTASGAALTAFKTATATLDPTVDLSSGFISGNAPAMVDVDNAEKTTAVVTLAEKSQGAAGYKSITGLAADKSYLLKDDTGAWYKVKADGAFEAIVGELTADAIGIVANATATRVSGLDNAKTYDVYEYTYSSTTSDVTVGADTKNRMVHVDANQAVIVNTSTGNGPLIVILDSAIADSGSTMTSPQTDPTTGLKIKTTGKDWTIGGGSYNSTSVFTFAAGQHFVTITGITGSSNFTFTRSAHG